MTDEKWRDDDKNAAPLADGPAVNGPVSNTGLSNGAILAFLAAAVLGALIVLGIKNALHRPDSSSSAELSDMQAQANALTEEVNRQRSALGYGPLGTNAEPIGDIAARLKKDSGSLVALAGKFQEMLAEKDDELAARSADLLRSETTRQTLSEEVARLGQQLRDTRVDSTSADLLRRDLESARARNDELSAALAEARAKVGAMSQGVAPEDYADLKRRLDETQRAKDFFEKRVKELGGSLPEAE